MGALLAACGSSSSGGDTANPGGDAAVDGNGGGAGDGGHGSTGDAGGGTDGTTGGGDSSTGGHEGGAGVEGGSTGSDGSATGGDSGASNGDAGGGSEGGACGPCTTPPDACHAKTGTCQSGACVYAFVNGATCDDGNACTAGDTCSNGACAGVPMVCDAPPAALCTSATTLRTYDTTGSCNGGLCVYTQHDVTCGAGGCVNASCSNDPCSGIVCNTPPAPVCADASTLKVYAASGACSTGQCSYTASLVPCAGGCAGNQCKPTGWTTMTSSTSLALYSVWGSSAADVWATGEQGVALHYVGGAWSVQSPPSTGLVWSVHGTAANDVYAIDSNNVVFKFDGTGWSKTSWTLTGVYDQCLFVDAPGSAWIGGQQSSTYAMALFRATSNVTMVAPTTVGTILNSGACSVWATSPTDVWLTGSSLLHYDGTNLTPVTGVGAAAVWASGSTVFAGAGTNVSIRSGGTWTSTNIGTNGSIEGMSGTAPNRVFVAIDQVNGPTAGEVRSYNGTGWTNEAIPSGTAGLQAVWAAPTGEVFAVGYGGAIVRGP